MAFGNQGASTKNREESANQYVRDDRWKHELKLVEGEAVMGRFMPFGSAGEPFPFREHGTAAQEKCVCMRPGNCHCCNVAAAIDSNREARDKGLVRMASPRDAYHFLSTRIIFDVPDERKPGKTKNAPRVVSREGAPLKVTNVKGQPPIVVPYPNGRHEYDEVYPWHYEGIVVLNLSASERAKQSTRLQEIEAKFDGQCQCNRSVGAPVPHFAKVYASGGACPACQRAVKTDGSAAAIRCTACGYTGPAVESIACEAECGNPRRSGLEHRYITVSATGSRLDKEIHFDEHAPSPITPEHAALLVNPDGTSTKLDLSEIYAPKEAHQASVLRSLAISLGAYGVNVNQVITNGAGSVGTATNLPPQPGVNGGNGIPSFGGPTAPRPPAPPQQVALPRIGGAPMPPAAGTNQQASAPLAGGAPVTTPATSPAVTQATQAPPADGVRRRPPALNLSGS